MNNNSITYNDIIETWNLISKFDKSKAIDKLYCNENTKDKMLERLNVMEWIEEYPNFLYGFNVITNKSIPENKVYILMQDGSVKILDLE